VSNSPAFWNLLRDKMSFVSLPTGYGKSLCYILLPNVFDQLWNASKQSIALVVSPLIALMEDQIATIEPMGISVTRISDKDVVNPAIKQGKYQIIISPEALGSLEWRSVFGTKLYRQNLIAFVIDEAHCIQKW
jgi:superfamily II DNA helicase RecQ